MPTQSTRLGLLGHVKKIASAVYPYTSTRGNTFPRLDLSVEYRQPGHIRLTSYDSEGKQVGTQGFTDIAEALVWTSAAIRYGETLYARKLRRRLEKESPAS